MKFFYLWCIMVLWIVSICGLTLVGHEVSSALGNYHIIM